MKKDRVVEKRRKAARRRQHVRKSVRGSANRPRLSVFRSARHIYAQIVDDDSGRSIAAVSSTSKEVRSESSVGGNIASARSMGQLLAEKAKTQGVSEVVFDRGSYLYHGRIKALADGAREGGLQF